MSFRDFIDRLTGRQRSSRHYGPGRNRSRSEPTIQLPQAQAQAQSQAQAQGEPGMSPAAAGRAVTAPDGTQMSPGPRPYSEPTPALGGLPAAAAPAAVAPAGSADAPTMYHETATYKKDDVAAVLVAIEGELKGEVYPLFDGENKLGRAEASDVVLPSKWISREHAMVVHQEGVFAIVPLTEKNRSYVNDREVDGAELSDGDTIRLGHTTFRFRSVEGL